jgi:hypothetical protein
LGEVQAAQGPESSEHWYVEPLSLELKAKSAPVEVVVPEGPEPIVVSGGVVSAGGVAACSVQLRVAGEGSVLPAASVAFTENEWEPTASPL